jgi:hypothetical protein
MFVAGSFSSGRSSGAVEQNHPIWPASHVPVLTIKQDKIVFMSKNCGEGLSIGVPPQLYANCGQLYLGAPKL